MKLTSFLFLLTFLNALGSETYSQSTRLSLDMKDASIQTVLRAIEDQSEFFFLYSPKMIDVNQKVNVNLEDKKINEILDDLLATTDIQYAVKDRQILLVNREAVESLDLQQNRVTGIVTEKNGTPIPGVNVVVTGTSQGTITDASGKYAIEIPEGSKTLTFTFIGMEPQVITIGNQSKIDISLAESAIDLGEVVVVGYGTQKKVDLTGSVSVMSSKEFEKAPVSDALDAMQGKLAGVTIISNSGEPGADKQIRIRGVQSWGASTDPLYVIDGVIMDNMSSLSPNDVENISVLKDAASSAIYGARAANGVVLITTKRGSKSGAPVISFETYAGVQQYSDLKPELLNSSQWLMLDEESYRNAGPAAYDQSPYGTQNPVDMNLFMVNGKLVNTDWLSVVGQPGRIQNYDLSISGGNEKSTYSTSATYFKQDGLIMNTGADRISFRYNADHKVTSFIEFGNSVNIYSTSRYGGVGNPYLGARRKNPISRPYEKDENGNIINYDYVRSYTMEGGDVGPLIYAKEYTSASRAYGFVGNVFLKVKILEGLTFTPRLSIDYKTSNSSAFTPELHIQGVETQSINNVYKNQDYNFHWTSDFMLNYEKSFGGIHNLSALFVYSQEESKYEYLNGTRYGTPNNQIQYLNAGILENQSVYNGYQDWAFVSYIGRLGYNYNEKYFIQGSIRRDGTSRFVGDNRWGVFPSVSAGWRISKEGFVEPLLGAINDLKIRGSFGTLGNSNVGLYPTYATLEMHTAVMGPQNGQYASPSYALGAAVNSNVKWEQTQKTDIGFDASFLNSKITATFDYYVSHTTNLLYGKPIPLAAGKYFYQDGWVYPSDPTINGGEIKNHGYEFSLGYNDSKGSFSWGVNGYMSIDRNEVVDLEGRNMREYGLEVGQPIYGFFGYTSNGIIKDQATLDAHPYLTNTENDFEIGLGDIWTVDRNKDGKITADDRGFIGHKYPNFTYGLSGNVTYNRWTLQVVTYGAQGVDLNTMVDINGYFQYTSNDVTRVLDRWEPTLNPDGNMPKVTKADQAGNATHPSSFWLSDASFLKISNVNLRYDIPENICQKLRMKGLEVYGSVENLHTFTKYPGGEVDVTDQGIWAQPVTKIPQPRTWVLGLKVSF
ncbi:MAG: TonB-dependent receptor [Bacteroidales bacterium]|nr:TonB-dependent receptor [Bacteroidales bacterium]